MEDVKTFLNELESEVVSMHQWKKIQERNSCDWTEEVENRSSLRWYRLAKHDGTGWQRMTEERSM